MAKRVNIGDVVTIEFPGHFPPGHEQEGYRPAIVIGLPERLGKPRYASVLVVPLTRDKGQSWAIASPKLYPRFPAGTARLHSPSIALLDQVRAVDAIRVKKRRGALTPGQFAPIQRGLRRMCNLSS